jgi:predicted transcriptional regulator
LGSYRGKLDIIADILHVASQNAKKTKIMFQANLSYKVLQRYLAEITDASLIVFDFEGQYYKITDKGRNFLNVYQEYLENGKQVQKKISESLNRKRLLEKKYLVNE